ncbi:MAG: sigma 54-interacting transcriptional regulator [candidate division Zixibacteria bacterium]|nr:sigma 54-interacting transcriptional regulator [candidate division Zixibacteria bacterium]
MSDRFTKDEITGIILDSIADGVFTVDRDWNITSFNRAAEEITGIPREEAIGQQCCDVFRASICEGSCALRETIRTGKPVVDKAIYIIDADGRRIPITISAAVLKDKNGEVIGGVETFRDSSAIEELRRELEKKYSFYDIISKNREMLRIFDILPEIAESNSTVLIDGESGTGKELIARALHNLSPRKDRPIVAVNCGALPDTLLESELFGYKAGAFTDARSDKPGRFALAEGGTIFLDEIAEVSPALQVRLLRVLQERVYEPLGATASVPTDVRVIAATNKDLEKLVKTGKFREDLYYRINVIRVTLPPLRERKEDIPLLVDHFIERFNRLKSKFITGIAPDALAILMNHDFPGNIRELENIIERAFVMTRGAIIQAAAFPDNLQPDRPAPEMVGGNSLEDIEAAYITEVLRKNGWNRQKTAEELGMHKTTLWRKIKKLGITVPE